MKKEEAIKEIGILKAQLNDAEAQLELKMQDLKLVLGLYKTEHSYGTRERVLGKHTWAELFAEIGRLKELARQKDQTEQLKYFEDTLFRFGDDIKDIKERTNLD